MKKMSKQANASNHTLTWREFVKATYPDILTKTCCVPPLHFNRVPYSRTSVPGIPSDLQVLVSQPPIGALSAPSGQPAPQQLSQTIGPLSSFQQAADSSATGNQADTATPPPSADGGTSSPTAPDTTPLSSSTSSLPHSSPPVSPPSLSDYSLWPTDTPPAAGTPTPVYLSDTTDDFSQQYLLYHLQALATHLGEVMFILSSVQFKNFLNSPSVGSGQFPRPRDLRKDLQGDFDFLILHRQRGVVVGELKAVGRLRAELGLSQAQDDASVVTKLEKGVKQLEKESTVVSHLVSDIHSSLPVHTALFLPFVSRSQLLRVLSAHPALAQKVCQCLHVTTSQEAVDVTLCSDDLGDPRNYWEITPQVYSQLASWWQGQAVPCSTFQLSDDQYLDIVGRFVGPATTVSIHCNARPRITVEVRTEGEALAELGMRLARLVLTPEQLDLLNRAPPRVFLTGPPGTGKSVMLILMALVWLHRGWNVQVVSLDNNSMAACQLVYHQIRKTLKSHSGDGGSVGQVFLHSFRFHNDILHEKVSEETAAKTLSEGAQGKPLAIIMDEMHGFTPLLISLRQTHPHLHLWGANIRKETPEGLQAEQMTRPLRSAPCVVRHIERAVMSRQYSEKVDGYSTEGIPSPADGLEPAVVVHEGQNHTSRNIASCYQCGVDVARALRAVGVGSVGRLVLNSPESLQFRDVFILEKSDSKSAHDELKDPEGRPIRAASRLVCGLRDEGLPVSVLEDRGHVEDREDKHRWRLHTAQGCTLPKEEPGEFDLSLDALFGQEQTEEVTWIHESETAKQNWQKHFAEGCGVESRERAEQWAESREKAREEWRSRLADVATARKDEVVVTTDRFVQGLERKVVVALMNPMTSFFAMDRMGCISRCTTHLIIVRDVRASADPTDTNADSDEEYAKRARSQKDRLL